MRTHGRFASILIYPRSGLTLVAYTRVATIKLGTLSTPTHGPQSSTQETVQSRSDCIYSSIHRPRGRSCPRLQLRRMFILLHMRVWPLRRAWADFRSYTSATAGVRFIALIPENQEAISPLTLTSMLLQP